MTDERTLKTELVVQLLVDQGNRPAQYLNQEGMIRGLVFALTGCDVGRGCGDREGVKRICSLLGWGYEDYGVSGWKIDWDDEVDEDKLASRGVVISHADWENDGKV